MDRIRPAQDSPRTGFMLHSGPAKTLASHLQVEAFIADARNFFLLSDRDSVVAGWKFSP